ncbi:shikimate kinase [bacterium]|nr:shikimate kinase [bacterium]
MPVDKRNIILVGMPAVGKSTLGVLLAKRLRYNFIDTDISIQVQNDATLAELIAAYGNERMLELEAEVLAAIQPSRCVIATGGSAVYSTDAMRHLRETGPIVYLRVAYDEVAKRVGDLTARGVVVPKGYTFRDIYDERCTLYEFCADVIVDTTGIGVEESLARVAKAVRAWLDDPANARLGD